MGFQESGWLTSSTVTSDGLLVQPRLTLGDCSYPCTPAGMRTSLSPGQPRPEGSSDVEKALPVLTELNLPATSMEVLAPHGAGPYLALRISPLLLPGPSVCVGGGGLACDEN